ncbi:hypothetical protein HNQ50_001405 [Silvimonas terrae]|uniref:Uncharacterized protein n=1 Tax=Silvimonas terrae TaxID=300266 RepID=A0A840REA2_9NEIS|nr:hypothetical protein [Silvimonas terrae]MBB5190683.1 hypothetical protein [Silvimonas terrae]
MKPGATLLIASLIATAITPCVEATKPSSSVGKSVNKEGWPPTPFDATAERLPPGYSGNNPTAFYRFFEKKTESMRKGEFETSDEYEARTLDLPRAIAPLNPGALYAFQIKKFERLSRFEYDPDQEVFHTPRYGYGCGTTKGPYNQWTICEVDEIVGKYDAYTGRNAFGSSRDVSRTRATEFALAIDITSPWYGQLMTSNGAGFQDSFSIPLARAKALPKEPISVLFVGKIIGASFIEGSPTIISPTIDQPYDVVVLRQAIPFEVKEVVYYVKKTGEILAKREFH